MKYRSFSFSVSLIVFLFLYAPLLVLLINSFNHSALGVRWEGFSLRWYQNVLARRDVWESIYTSLALAVAASFFSTLLGTLSALAMYFYRGRLQSLHRALISLAIFLPEVLMGLSLLLLFMAWRLQLGFYSLLITHVTFCFSFVALVVYARLQDFNYELLEAARDLGASWTQTTRYVLLPLLAPGILAGALLAFTLSIDDFVISFFVAGAGTTTLPLRIYSMIKFGKPAAIYALSSLLLIFTSLILLIGYLLFSRRSAA